MRNIFHKHVYHYTFKPEEIDASELSGWGDEVLTKLIEKFGITVGHLKAETTGALFVAYFDCKFHKKSQYMIEIPEYDVWHAETTDEINVLLTMKKNGVKCPCLKKYEEQGIWKLISMLLGRTDEQEMDEDSDAEEMDVDVQNEPESCIEIPNFDNLKELEVLLNKKRKERTWARDAEKIKMLEDEIQKIFNQIINF